MFDRFFVYKCDRLIICMYVLVDFQAVKFAILDIWIIVVGELVSRHWTAGLFTSLRCWSSKQCFFSNSNFCWRLQFLFSDKNIASSAKSRIVLVNILRFSCANHVFLGLFYSEETILLFFFSIIRIVCESHKIIDCFEKKSEKCDL